LLRRKGARLSESENEAGSAYGWVVVASAFTLMFVGFSAAYSFAAFFTAYQAEFGASRGHIALVFSVAAFLWFLAGAPGGVLADRFGARRVALAGVACLAAALALAAVSRSVGVLYVTYSVGIGLGVGLVYVPSVGAVQPWFGANRAFASGIAVAGIGAGNIAGPLLAAWWIGLYGWRGAYVALAIFVLVLGGIAASLLRNRSIP
jgi:MFS family permease